MARFGTATCAHAVRIYNAKVAARTPRKVFDEAYYKRFYHDESTQVIDASDVGLLGAFVCTYLAHLQLDVRRVLDIGCGIGLWCEVIDHHFPTATLQGYRGQRVPL